MNICIKYISSFLFEVILHIEFLSFYVNFCMQIQISSMAFGCSFFSFSALCLNYKKASDSFSFMNEIIYTKLFWCLIMLF